MKTEPFMTIRINDQSLELEAETDVQSLIDRYLPASRHLIVDINGEIIRRESWRGWPLRDNDRIELIQLVGGG